MSPRTLGLEYQWTGSTYQRRPVAVNPPAPSPGGGGGSTGGGMSGDPAWPDPTVRPTGTNFVAFEDIYTAAMGESKYALNQVINSDKAAGKIVTLPEAQFIVGKDGWDGVNDGTYNPALWDKSKRCRGLWGSGQGGLGVTNSGTIITVAPQTCSNPAVGGGAIAWGLSGSVSTTLKFIHFESTYQGQQTGGTAKAKGSSNGLDYVSEKLHTLVYVFNCPKVLVEDCFFNGWYANNGAPPGETFGLEVYGTAQGASNHIVRRCEADGRRAVGGQNFGGPGFGTGNCDGFLYEDTYAHHQNAAMAYAVFQAGHGTFNRLRAGSFSDAEGSAEMKLGAGVNMERVWNMTFNSPTVYGAKSGKQNHFFYSCDQYVDSYGNASTNGGLTINAPVYNDIWGDGKLYLQTWGPTYNAGDGTKWGGKETNTIAPTVVDSTGANLPYKWSYCGTNYNVVSGDTKSVPA